jgi:large subunit ribosomal protein L25
MEAIELITEPRSVVGKQTRALRRAGQVPVVVYGPGVEPLNLQAEARHLRRVLTQAGETRLITIKVGERTFPALARDIQRNPIRGDFIHVDLYAVDITKKITTSVPLVFSGEPEIVRNNRALLTHAISDIEIECLPTDLPPSVRVNVLVLKEIGDALHVSDLPVLPGVEYRLDPHDLVVKIIPLAAQAAEPVAEVAVVSPEVEVVKAKGKEEEEEEE